MRNRFRRGAAALLLSGIITPQLAAAEPAAETWPAWRGPASAGSATSGDYRAEWSASENLLWKAELPGIGRSTPIVWGGQIFLTCPADGEDAVLALDWEGKLRWTTPVGKGRGGKHRNGSGANSSPVTDGEIVFAYFRSGNLAAVDVDGKLLWKTNLQERFAEDTLWWDIGSSPVLTRHHLVVAVIQQGESFLVAFDKRSGDLAWKVDRNYECSLEGDHSYTTPLVVENAGNEVIVVWGAEHLTGHAATDGELLWSCGGFNPERKRNWVTVSSAVVAGDIAVVPYGRGQILEGIRLHGKGDVTKTHRLWARTGVGSFVPTPAVHDGKVYVLGDRGSLECIDPSTGKTVSEGSLPPHRSKYYASPVIAGDKLLAAREDGVVFTVRLSGQFEVIGENDMGEGVIASPVPIGGKVLVRSERHLFCVAAP